MHRSSRPYFAADTLLARNRRNTETVDANIMIARIEIISVCRLSFNEGRTWVQNPCARCNVAINTRHQQRVDWKALGSNGQQWLINSTKAYRGIHEAGFAYCLDQHGCTFEAWRWPIQPGSGRLCRNKQDPPYSRFPWLHGELKISWMERSAMDSRDSWERCGIRHSYYTIGCCVQYGQHFWRILWYLHIRGFCFCSPSPSFFLSSLAFLVSLLFLLSRLYFFCRCRCYSSKLCYRSRSQWIWQFWLDRSGLIIPNW